MDNGADVDIEDLLTFLDHHIVLADSDSTADEHEYDDLPDLISANEVTTSGAALPSPAARPPRSSAVARSLRNMAIEHIPHPDAENLVNSKDKTFYPMRIPVSHWQLRHYISTPEPDQLYYASGRDVFCLQPSTRKRKHIATLPFEARCTASGYGWVCVGGEDEGHFAAIKVEGVGLRGGDGGRVADVKVDRIGEEIVNSISIHRIRDEEAHLDDIVAVLTNNDKTVRVYSLPQSLETCVLDLPFAMNHATVSPDGTVLVAVGDLNQAYFFQRELRGTPPQIPKPHNRLTSGSVDWRLTNVVTLHTTSPEATMGYFTTAWSPNGRMVAVGSEGGYITVLDTTLLNVPDLDDEDAIIAIVPSSRPDVSQPHPGAVRSMVFSPDPWDLLIWAEDQGRICVGDLRTKLRRKQVVHLHPREEGLRKVEFEDLPFEGPVLPNESHGRSLDQSEMEFIHRYRHAQDNATAVNFATEYIEARRRQRQHRQDLATIRGQSSGTRTALDDDPQGLTAREQQILNTLRTSRQREEARSQGVTPAGVNYTTPDMFSTGVSRTTSSTQTAVDSSTLAPRPARDILSGMSDTSPELVRTNIDSRPGSSGGAAISTWATNPYDELERLTTSPDGNTTGSARQHDGSRFPRRRASVILSPPATASTSDSSRQQPISATTPSIWTPHTPSSEEENPWRTITDAMTLARGPLFESAARAPPIPSTQASTHAPRPTEAELATSLAAERVARARSLQNQRERWRAVVASDSGIATGANATLPTTDVRRLAGFPEGYETVLRRMRGAGGGVTGRELGVRTAGLAVSEDGATVWAATEEGIFEICVGRKGRMFFPALEPV